MHKFTREVREVLRLFEQSGCSPGVNVSPRGRKNEEDRRDALIITREKYLLIKERRHSFVSHLISIPRRFSLLYIPFRRGNEKRIHRRMKEPLTPSCKLFAIPSIFHLGLFGLFGKYFRSTGLNRSLHPRARMTNFSLSFTNRTNRGRTRSKKDLHRGVSMGEIHPDTHHLMLPQSYVNKRNVGTWSSIHAWKGRRGALGHGVGPRIPLVWCHFLFGHSTIGPPIQRPRGCHCMSQVLTLIND